MAVSSQEQRVLLVGMLDRLLKTDRKLLVALRMCTPAVVGVASSTSGVVPSPGASGNRPGKEKQPMGRKFL